MKKKQFFALLLTVIYCFTMCGFFSSSRKYIKAGDKALEKFDYQTAIENYRKAGEDGKEKLESVYYRDLQRKYSLEKDSNLKKLIESIEKLNKEESDKSLVTRVLTKLLEVEMLPDLEKAKSNEAAAEKVGSVTKHMEHILDVLALFPDQNQKFVKDLTKELKDYLFEDTFQYVLSSAGNAYRKIGDWDRVLDLCKEAEEGSLGHQILKAYEKNRKNPNMENAKELQKILDNKVWAANFWNYITQDYEPKTLNDHMQFNAVNVFMKGAYYTASETKKNLTEIYNPKTMAVGCGIDSRQEKVLLTTSMQEELKEACGKQAENKILFLHDRAVYNSQERKMDLALWLMSDLPESYMPENLQQVKYLIYLKSDYTKGGMYYGGTQQIIESTSLSLYDTETGKVIYSKYVSGKTSDVMYYTGNKPAYYSAESPDICAALQEAMNKIYNLEK